MRDWKEGMKEKEKRILDCMEENGKERVSEEKKLWWKTTDINNRIRTRMFKGVEAAGSTGSNTKMTNDYKREENCNKLM